MAKIIPFELPCKLEKILILNSIRLDGCFPQLLVVVEKTSGIEFISIHTHTSIVVFMHNDRNIYKYVSRSVNRTLFSLKWFKYEIPMAQRETYVLLSYYQFYKKLHNGCALDENSSSVCKANESCAIFRPYWLVSMHRYVNFRLCKLNWRVFSLTQWTALD